MKSPLIRLPLLAGLAAIATARLAGAEAEPDPVAAIQAITNRTARGTAWVKHLSGLAERSLPQAAGLLASATNSLTGSQLADLYARLAVLAVSQTSDPDQVTAFVRAILDARETDARTDAEQERLEAYKSGRLAQALSEMTGNRTGDPDLARRLFREYRPLLNADQIASLEADLLIVAANEGDREDFERDLAAYRQPPLSGSRLAGLARIARAIRTLDNAWAETLLRDALAEPALAGTPRLQLLAALADVAFSGDPAESYPRWKSVQQEILAMADRGEVPLRLNLLPFGRAFEFGDHLFAADLIRRALAADPGAATVRLAAAQGAFLTNDLRTAAGHLEAALKDASLRPDTRKDAEALLFLAGGNGVAALDRAFSGEKPAPEEKLRILYRVSEFLFRCRQYDHCRAIHAEIVDNLFVPIERKAFTVRYVPRAPQTAEGWTHDPSYRDWERMETRFVPYGDLMDYSLQADIDRRLKSAVQPEIPAGYRTGVFFLCDDEGLHIYVRADDPHVDEIAAHRRSGGNLDMNFKAGAGNAPYNIWFRNLPDATEGYIVDWASPTETYSLARDIFRRDAVTTPEGLAAHVLVPWPFFCTQLPFDGNDWLFGMVRSVPGVGKQALTGNHQEFGRLLRLQFDVPPPQRIGLKRRVACQTFSDYSRLRNNPSGFLLEWKDDVLGDPDFFASEIEPLLRGLDAAGARLTGEKTLDDREVDDFFVTFVPAWHNIRYVVAGKRAAFLRNRLFQ